MEDADAEHNAGDEADRDLHPAMGELKPNGQHAADNRRDENQRAIIGEKDSWHEVRNRGRESVDNEKTSGRSGNLTSSISGGLAIAQRGDLKLAGMCATS